MARVVKDSHIFTCHRRIYPRMECSIPACCTVCVGHPEFDFDDSDRSSVYSTPSPQTRQFRTLAPPSVGQSTGPVGAAAVASSLYRHPLGMTAYHPSLRKKRWFERQSTVSVMTGRLQSTLEKSWSIQSDRPLSMLHSPYCTESQSVIANKVADTLLQQVATVLLYVAVSSLDCSAVLLSLSFFTQRSHTVCFLDDKLKAHFGMCMHL